LERACYSVFELAEIFAPGVRDGAGLAQAQQQLSHANWRPPRLTICSGRPAALTCGPCWINTQVAIVETESIRKVSDSGPSPAFVLTTDSTTSGCGAPEEIRTPNLLIRSQMLYPLSYGRLCSIVSGGGGERI
jgi:hypothetical protein